MAAAGIGVDMLEISRMERVIERRPNFLRRVFTEEERAYCERSARPAEHYAARWAAREAVVKALGCGFGNGVGIRDVSVVRDERGGVRAQLTGGAAKVALEKGVVEVALSISYTREVAVANAVAVTEAVKPKVDPKEDAARALAASFREAKSVLDELERVEDAQMQLPLEQVGADTTAVAASGVADLRASAARAAAAPVSGQTSPAAAAPASSQTSPAGFSPSEPTATPLPAETEPQPSTEE